VGIPLISVFVDGLRPDWIRKMPFVRSVASPNALRTEFGYSIACHATMYTGLSIQDHGYWFVWLRNAQKSMFKSWLSRVPSALDQVPTRLLMRKALLHGMPDNRYPRGYFRVPRLVHVPMRQWPGLWVSEEKFWDEDNYAPSWTIFELARAAGRSLKTVGFHRGDQQASLKRPLRSDELDCDWYYLFTGAVDHAAHKTGGEGSHFEAVLLEVDAAIAARCNQIERRRGGFDFLLWSDHGHLKASRRVDIYDRVPKTLMASVPHVVDANFARFWTPGTSKRQEIVNILSRKMPEGRILSEEELKRYECWFPDFRYGDIVFYLDAPAVFARTAWGYSNSQKSIHGYTPDNDAMSAALVTTLPDVEITQLREIFGLHKLRLGLG
jgi:hypothetical protein